MQAFRLDICEGVERRDQPKQTAQTDYELVADLESRVGDYMHLHCKDGYFDDDVDDVPFPFEPCSTPQVFAADFRPAEPGTTCGVRTHAA